MRKSLNVLTPAALSVASCLLLSACATMKGEDGAKRASWTKSVAEQQICSDPALLPVPHEYTFDQITIRDLADESSARAYAFEEGVVLADVQGPGCITRIWTAEPWGDLVLWVDDMEKPAFMAPFAQIFSGKVRPFRKPVVGSKGGYYAYLPIPFKERVRVTVYGSQEANDYQISLAKFPQGTEIASFTGKNKLSDVVYLMGMNHRWRAADEVRFWDEKTEKFQRGGRQIMGLKTSPLFAIDGPGVLMELEIRMQSHVANAAEKSLVEVFIDGESEPSVSGPLNLLFGTTSLDADDFGGHATGRLESRYYCRYPMPFAEGVRIRMTNATDQPLETQFNVTYREQEVDGLMRLHTGHRTAVSAAGAPYEVAAIQGQGLWVGCILSAGAEGSFAYLDGAETLEVDNVAFVGTGLADYFNSAGRLPEAPFDAPTHGMTLRETQPLNAVSVYRNRLTDAIPFKESFRLSFAHGDHNNQPGTKYESMAFWYSGAE